MKIAPVATTANTTPSLKKQSSDTYPIDILSLLPQPQIQQTRLLKLQKEEQ